MNSLLYCIAMFLLWKREFFKKYKVKFFLFLNDFQVYFFVIERERARENTSWGGAEREGDTEPNAGVELSSCEIMT